VTLRTRLVAALLAAAIVPMALVVVVPLLRAADRAREDTSRRVEDARRQAAVLLDRERDQLKEAADRAASDLASDRQGLPAILRGPEAVASPVAGTLAERYSCDRIVVTSESGAILATHGNPAAGPALVEERPVPAGAETLRLRAERDLGPPFVALVRAIAGGEAHVGADPAACATPRAEVAVVPGTTLCVAVAPADPRAVRIDLLRSFAGTAPVAIAVALVLGLLLAARIARPIRELTDRAEEISQRHAGPLTLLEDGDETRRLTIAFDRMLLGLSASERQRVAAERVAAWEEIARRLAHEIKNPLSPIQLAVENLRRTRERAPEELDRALREETATILEEVDALRRLVDEFAQFARLPRLSVAPCDPRAIVAGALSLYAARIEDLHVTVEVDAGSAPPSILADAEQLGRALKNVVQNALDAMEASERRALSVAVRAAEGGRTVEFEVRDTGEGLDREALARVFEPYFSTRTDRGGTGLGLAIAHRIAAEHGGSIRVDGAEGRGATFTIVLPLETPPPQGGRI
jgi:two-component system nitrogen regulation sensor histidine kinase NtrY